VIDEFAAPPAERRFSQIGESHYELSIPSAGLRFDVDRLRRDHHDLIGELCVECSLAGARTVDGSTLSIATFNLSSATARQQRAKYLREQSDSELDFGLYLEELCQRTITAERAGSPSRPLHTYDRPGPDTELDIDGLRLLRDHPTILFGDGGSAKSYLALYIAGTLAGRGVSVLFCDWELGGSDHRDRLERLFGVDMPPVHYLRCDRPLIDEADRIGREVHRLSINYTIHDSIGVACAGPPEAAEHATGYFRAVRQIGVGSLHVAHISKADGADQKPFGSAFWHNSARSTWFVQRADESPDGQQINVGLFNRKANLGRLQPALGFQFTFESDRTRVQRIDLTTSDDLAPKLPTWQRMRQVLRTGPMTIPALADELDLRPEAVKKAAQRGDGRMFTRVVGADGSAKIGLVERRAT
jgi:hypothetical protein